MFIILQIKFSLQLSRRFSNPAWEWGGWGLRPTSVPLGRVFMTPVFIRQEPPTPPPCPNGWNHSHCVWWGCEPVLLFWLPFWSPFLNDLILCRLVAQSCLFVTPWPAARQASLSFTISQSLLQLLSIESVMPSNHPILCRRVLLPSIFPSIRVFSNEAALWIRWPKYWSFSFSTSTGPYSQCYGFSSGHVRMWELDHKEG